MTNTAVHGNVAYGRKDRRENEHGQTDEPGCRAKEKQRMSHYFLLCGKDMYLSWYEINVIIIIWENVT